MHKREMTLAIASLVVVVLAPIAAAQDPKPTEGVVVVPASAPATLPAAAPGAPSGAPGAPAAAAEPELVFEREIFVYPGSGRRDPFKPLTGQDALGPLFEDLTLRMVIYSAVAPGQSVAVLGDGQKKTYRVRRGDTLGNATVVEIAPKRVTFSINELGNWRREVLELKPDNK